MDNDSTLDIFIPGRLCILGEHSDWAAEYRDRNPSIPIGYTLVCATNEGIYGKISLTSDNVLHFKTTVIEMDNMSQNNSIEISLHDKEKLLELARLGGLYSYVCGTTYIMINHPKYISKSKHYLHGISIDNYKTTLPIKKGLSSSAAICVLIAQSFNQMYELQLDSDEIMNIAYQGEMLTPSQCGRMDQCVVMGPGAIAVMEFYGSNHHSHNTDTTTSTTTTTTTTSTSLSSSDMIQSCPISNSIKSSQLPCKLRKLSCKTTLYFVVVDLMAQKDTVEILKQLNQCFPIASNPIQQSVHAYIQNNEYIIKDAIKAIEIEGDVVALGQLMNTAQCNFDLCALNCPSQLLSPILHKLIHALMNDYNQQPATKNSILSVKGVGSQGDGSAQILCISEQAQQQLVDYITKEFNMHAFSLTIPSSSSLSATNTTTNNNNR